MVSPESFPLHIWLVSLRLKAESGPLSFSQLCLSQAECLPQGHSGTPGTPAWSNVVQCKDIEGSHVC